MYVLSILVDKCICCLYVYTHTHILSLSLSLSLSFSILLSFFLSLSHAHTHTHTYTHTHSHTHTLSHTHTHQPPDDNCLIHFLKSTKSSKPSLLLNVQHKNHYTFFISDIREFLEILEFSPATGVSRFKNLIWRFLDPAGTVLRNQ